MQNLQPAVNTSSRAKGYIAYYKPHTKTRALLDDAQAVLEEYHDHWPLTVRQIFYRLVGAHGFPKTEAFYGTLCHHLANARRGRVIPFDAIRDDGTSVLAPDHYADKDAFIRDLQQQGKHYTRDKMAGQRLYVEVWCEAAGMIYQLSEVAEPYSIKVYSSSGFDSLTAKKMLADRICAQARPAIILHLGDYDPSGESIFHSMAEDVRAFVTADRLHGLVNVEFRRVALTTDQVEGYDLPTSPAKASDSRSKQWGGNGTCQLEALPPDTLAELLQAEIESLLDLNKVNEAEEAEQRERAELTRFLLTAGG